MPVYLGFTARSMYSIVFRPNIIYKKNLQEEEGRNVVVKRRPSRGRGPWRGSSYTRVENEDKHDRKGR
jgi:hypothetical protein